MQRAQKETSYSASDMIAISGTEFQNVQACNTQSEQSITSVKRWKDKCCYLQMCSRVRHLPVFIENHNGHEIHHLCPVSSTDVDSMTW